jgi:ubiquinone/menaquinone biosynthesis C-methylase UbiE
MTKQPEDYEDIFTSPGGKLVSTFEIDQILDLLGQPSRNLILDIGTGTGRLARHLLKLNNDIVGVDISSDRLKLALHKSKNVLKNYESNYYIVKASGEYLPFKSGTFDKVYSVRVIKYMKNANLCFKDISRVLKVNGLSVIELSNIYSYERMFLLYYRFFSKSQYAKNMGPAYQLFNIASIEKTLNSENLSVDKRNGWHKIPTVVFIKCRNLSILKMLFSLELVLQKTLPAYFFSRGIVLRARKIKTE